MGLSNSQPPLRKALFYRSASSIRRLSDSSLCHSFPLSFHNSSELLRFTLPLRSKIIPSAARRRSPVAMDNEKQPENKDQKKEKPLHEYVHIVCRIQCAGPPEA